jgi:hypothetical protein
MESGPRGDGRWPKWALFIALLIATPVPFYMVVVGGVVPMIYLLSLAVRGTIVALPKFSVQGFLILGVVWLHAAAFAGLLYLASSGIHRVLFRVLPRRYAIMVVIALIGVLFASASVFNLYLLPGHNAAPPANIFRFLREFVA